MKFNKKEKAYLNDIGIITAVSDGVVSVKGIKNVANGELITYLIGNRTVRLKYKKKVPYTYSFEQGLILNLEKDKVSSIVLSNER